MSFDPAGALHLTGNGVCHPAGQVPVGTGKTRRRPPPGEWAPRYSEHPPKPRITEPQGAPLSLAVPQTLKEAHAALAPQGQGSQVPDPSQADATSGGAVPRRSGGRPGTRQAGRSRAPLAAVPGPPAPEGLARGCWPRSRLEPGERFATSLRPLYFFFFILKKYVRFTNVFILFFK